MNYSAPPQQYTTVFNPQTAREMSAEQVVCAMRSRDREERANALEFVGRPIDRIMPRQRSLPTDPTIICSCCGEEKPRNAFGDDPRKFNKKQSRCRKCESRRRVVRYHDGKRQAIRERLQS